MTLFCHCFVFWVVHKNSLWTKWGDIPRILQNTLGLARLVCSYITSASSIILVWQIVIHSPFTQEDVPLPSPLWCALSGLRLRLRLCRCWNPSAAVWPKYSTFAVQGVSSHIQNKWVKQSSKLRLCAWGSGLAGCFHGRKFN